MKVKNEKCKYCKEPFEPKTTRAEFCSTKCRVYWNRENVEEVVKENNKPKNKKRILAERNKKPKKAAIPPPLPEDEMIPPPPEGKENAVQKMLREQREKFSKQYKTK